MLKEQFVKRILLVSIVSLFTTLICGMIITYQGVSASTTLSESLSSTQGSGDPLSLLSDLFAENGSSAGIGIETGMEKMQIEELKRIDSFLEPQINSTGQAKTYEVITVPEMNNTLWKNITFPSIGINMQIPDNWNASVKDKDFFTYSGKLYDMSIDPKLTSNNFSWLGPQAGETTVTISNKGAPVINNTTVLANVILKNCISNAYSESDCELIEPVSSSKYLIDKQPATSFKYKSYDEEFEYVEVIHNGVNYEIQFDFKEPGLDYLSSDYNSQNIESSEKANQIKDHIINSIRWVS